MNIRMTTKGKRPLRSLTPCDKINAIQRIHDGESKASVARDIGVPESTLRGWCKNEEKLRFMSRQGFNEKLPSKLDNTLNILGPCEKKQRFDTNLPLNFSNKIKFDDLAYKRCSMNTLDLANKKQIVEMELNGIAHEFAVLNGSPKTNIFETDVSRSLETPLSAISSLTGFPHLSNLNSISQSPLGLSFSELTSNLNFLAQLHPNLAAISNIGNLPNSNSAMDLKGKPFAANGSNAERNSQAGLSVKNWAKQNSTGENKLSSGTTATDNNKNMLKLMNPMLNTNNPSPLSVAEDPLMYWLKTQQAMLGLNSLCNSTTVPPLSPPKRSSTPQPVAQNISPQHMSPQLNAPPFPLENIENKNMAWLNWCKALGASLSTIPAEGGSKAKYLNPNAMPPNCPPEVCLASLQNISNIPIENILYSELTKKSSSPSVQSASSTENIPNSESANDPEDLSANSAKSKQATSRSSTGNGSPARSDRATPITSNETDAFESNLRNIPSRGNEFNQTSEKTASKNSKKYPASESQSKPPSPLSYVSETSYHNDTMQHYSEDFIINNNNNISNKTDEEEKLNNVNSLIKNSSLEALKHGETFLQWLEKCSNPRITSVQLIQLRILIEAVRMDVYQRESIEEDSTTNNSDENEKSNDLVKTKIRRRK